MPRKKAIKYIKVARTFHALAENDAHSTNFLGII